MLPQAPDQWTIFEASHLLNRAGFGGSPAEIRTLHAMGRQKAVDSLLQPTEAVDAVPMPEWMAPEALAESMQKPLQKAREFRKETKGMSTEEAEQKRREAFKVIQQENRQRGIEAQGWWFRRMLQTKAPLREKMALFWHDHFATSIQKVKQPGLLMLQNDLFRRNALGSFRTLTHAIAKDPAMMLYLDTQNSKKGKPNENFAREVMELFTLGEGSYTEQDIREAARAFTGYQLNRANGNVFHNKRQWDDGAKTVFGKTGNFDGDQVIDLIFEKPQAAALLATKLWEYFGAEDPPQKAIDALAGTLRGANYDVVPLLREIFLSKEFYSESVMRNQIKAPVQFLIQMLKELELHDAPRGYTMYAQQQLGQVLFNPPNVAGWDWGKAWINTNTLLTRYNVAGFITKGSQSAPGLAAADDQEEDTMMKRGDKQLIRKKGSTEKLAGALDRMGDRWDGPDYEKIAPRTLRNNHADLVDALAFRFFQSPLSEKNRARFMAFAEEKHGVTFTDHEVAELVHLMMSTPEYQLA